MKCVICEFGETEPGTATITLEREATIIVIKSVPADVCQVCGEAYTDQEVTRNLLRIAEERAQSGPKEEFIQYVA
jgi:YgiT-type zinc finger domain-containing protein